MLNSSISGLLLNTFKKSAVSLAAAAAFTATALAVPAAGFELPSYDPSKTPYKSAPWIDATGYFHELAQKTLDTHGTPLENITRIRRAPSAPKTEGMKEEFFVMNIAANKAERRSAILKKIGKHCYLYLEEGKDFPDAVLRGIVDRFDETIYGACTETFGSEPRPGIDNDERVTLLMADIKDGWEPGKGFVGGYFSPLDCYPASVVQYSNEREMIYLDCYPSKPEDPSYPGVIAHEFQHMIHFANDPREDKWLNEGCSQLAIHVCGCDHPSQILSYAANPGDDATAWQNSVEDYGAAYLLHYYIYKKYAGATAADKMRFYRALVASPLKGIESIDAVLAEFGVGRSFEDIYKDWLTANLINRPDAGGGLYGYDESLTLRSRTTHNLSSLPAKIERAELLNHGAANILFTPFTTHLPQTPTMIEKFEVYSQKPAVMIWGINGWQTPPEKYIPRGTVVSGGLAETVMGGPNSSGFYFAEIGPLSGAAAADTFDYKFKYEDGTTSEAMTINIIGPSGRSGISRSRSAEKDVLIVKFRGSKPSQADPDKLLRLIEIIEDDRGAITVGEVPLNKNQAKIAVPSYGKSAAKVYFIAYQASNKKLAFSLEADVVSNMKEAGKAFVLQQNR